MCSALSGNVLGGGCVVGCVDCEYMGQLVHLLLHHDNNIVARYPFATAVDNSLNIQWVSSHGAGGNLGAGWVGRFSRGTLKNPSPVLSLDRLGFMLWGGWDGAAWAQFAGFEARANENWSPGNCGAFLDLIATPDGSAVRQTRMRLRGEGHLDKVGGTVNPTANISAGSLFYRTDLHMWIEYDGTRWLSVSTFTLERHEIWHSATTTSKFGALRTDYDFWVDHWEMHYYVSGVNDGANYWTCDLLSFILTGATGTVLDVFDTSAQAGNTWYAIGRAPNTAQTHAVDKHWLYARSTKTGAPGNILIAGTAICRLIIT